MSLLHPILTSGAHGTGHLPAPLLDDREYTLPISALTALARWIADAPALWRPIVRHDPAQRWYTRLALSGTVEIWLIGWRPGQHTAVHDHGGALGALAVADGSLEEIVHDRSWIPHRRRSYAAGTVVAFGPDHVHQVTGIGAAPATSIHAYSPPAMPMRYSPAAAPVAATV